MVKGEASFEHLSYELPTFRKTYSESALREGIQRSLKGDATDTVHNMGPGVSLDTIINKFSIMYENIKSFDLLMRDFYSADQGEDETFTSFAMWDKFPDQIPLQEEQRLLKDRLFHGSYKSIQDSVKYCHADSKVDYMTFLKECRKAEDEDRIGQTKFKGKLKAAVATIPSPKSDEIAKQLKKQQIDTLVGKMKTLATTLQTAWAWASFRQGSPSFGMKGIAYTDRRGDPGSRGLPPQSRLRGGSPFHRVLPPSLDYCTLNWSRGL